jgi:hypothetical protein
MLVTNPWLSWFAALGPPTHWEVDQFLQTGVFIDWMMKASEHRFGPDGHTVPEELPCAILNVVLDVSDRFCAGLNGV